MARKRQRNNIVQKQVVWGKEFTGRPFLSEPAEILFKDFTVNKTERRRVVLTNVSFSFNTFKLLPLPDDIKDFFEIEYKKPGRMSAGMTCTIHITFHPKVNKDILADLPCLAQTGPFTIPLLCTTKKAVPSVSTQDISFQNVVMGESSTFKLVISNNGALPVHCTLENAEPDGANADVSVSEQVPVPETATDEESLLAIAASVTVASEGERKGRPVTFAPACTVEPYSKTVVKITFKPHHPGSMEVPMRLSFAEEGCDDVPLLVRCHAVPVPIFVEPPILDFRCCVYRKLYRAKVVLHNRGQVALKMLAQVPDELQGALEFNPTLGFVQGCSHSADGVDVNGTFEVQIKFRPQPGLLQQCGRHALAHGGHKGGEAPGVIAVPVRLTTSEILFETPCIDDDVADKCEDDAAWGTFDGNFGSCFTTQSATIPVRMTNMSALPQQYGFVQLPREISVQPEDGFGILVDKDRIDFGQLAVGKSSVVVVRVRNLGSTGASLRMQGLNPIGAYSVINAIRPIAPKSYQDLQVKFEPPGQLHFCETLVLFSETGKASIALSGEGVSPALTVEPASGVIDMGHICAGESTEATFTLHNSTAFPLTYVIRPKKRQESNLCNVAPFSCVPVEATIAAGGSQTVTARFMGDHDRPTQFVSTFVIDVPNQQHEHTMTLKGWAWSRQAFVVPASLADALDVSAPETVQDPFAAPPQMMGSAASGGGRLLNRLIRLNFPRSRASAEAAEKQIVVGCTAVGKDRKGGNASFDIELTGDVASNFACTQLKGSVAPGQQQVVGFTFVPDQSDASSGLSGIDAGHWVECRAVCTVTGGFVPGGGDDTQVFDVVLRGWLSR
eukprot:g6935.t1